MIKISKIRSFSILNYAILFFLASGCSYLLCNAGGGNNLIQLREIMVKKQIEDRGITDKRVLQAMYSVERHKFIPDQQINAAYEDHPLPIGYEQTISQPYIVALMSELCELKGDEKVLEIGTGSGYQAAVLSLLAKKVYSIELIEPLSKSAALRLKNLGYKNIEIKAGDGFKGWPEYAPFDVIMLTACPPEIPEALLDQLKEGGIMVAPVGNYQQELVKIEKRGGAIFKKTITYVRFVPMVHGHN
jgi:protein-L-isoaspartate(D-aspartate) O-methyltransferase